MSMKQKAAQAREIRRQATARLSGSTMTPPPPAPQLTVAKTVKKKHVPVITHAQ